MIDNTEELRRLTTENVSEVFGMVEAKKLRILAVPAVRRLTGIPEVPTLKELGYNIHVGSGRGFDENTYMGSAEFTKYLADHLAEMGDFMVAVGIKKP